MNPPQDSFPYPVGSIAAVAFDTKGFFVSLQTQMAFRRKSAERSNKIKVHVAYPAATPCTRAISSLHAEVES